MKLSSAKIPTDPITDTGTHVGVLLEKCGCDEQK